MSWGIERERELKRERKVRKREREGRGKFSGLVQMLRLGQSKAGSQRVHMEGRGQGASVLEPSLLPARVLMSRKLELASRGSSLSFLLWDSGTANGVKKKSYLSGRVKRDREIFSLLVLLVPPQMVKTTRARPA